MNIAQSSPLYDYWHSEQDESDENLRLSKLNQNEPAANLFQNEPYKWEILYQSSIRNIIKGDESSIKSLMVLLSTINIKEKEKLLNRLEFLLDKPVIYKLRNKKYEDIKSIKVFWSFLITFFNIFINPYDLQLKKEPKYLYEKTGMLFYQLRNLVFIK